MGCGKSKHDVVTGNTTTVRKPSEPESVKGKENESIKRQESCRCRKKNEISAVVPGDQTETTVENNTKKPKEKEGGGDCGEKIAVEMTNGDIEPEVNETTTTLPPVTSIVPGNIMMEETVDDVKENVAPIEEQQEEINMETMVEKEKSLEDTNEDDVDSKIPSPEVEEQKLDKRTQATESEVQEIPTTENDETAALAATENDEIAALENEDIAKDNDEIAVAENDEITTTENEETPVLEDDVAVDALEESPVDITKDDDSA